MNNEQCDHNCLTKIQNVRQYIKDNQIVFSKLEDNLSILGTCIIVEVERWKRRKEKE